MTKHKYQELLEIIAEEADIVDEDDGFDDNIDAAALRRAYAKIRSGGSLNAAEKSAVRDALDDLGNLYRFAGTASGFDSDSPGETRSMRHRGKMAWLQAGDVGAAFNARSPQGGYVTTDPKDPNIVRGRVVSGRRRSSRMGSGPVSIGRSR